MNSKFFLNRAQNRFPFGYTWDLRDLWESRTDYEGWRETDCALAVARLMDYAGQHSPHLPLEKLAVAAGFAAFGPSRANCFFLLAWQRRTGRRVGRMLHPPCGPYKEKNTSLWPFTPAAGAGWGEFPLPVLPRDSRLFVKQRTPWKGLMQWCCTAKILHHFVHVTMRLQKYKYLPCVWNPIRIRLCVLM